MSNTNTGGPAFPESGPRGQASGGEGMTLRQYAAIKLKVPNSGTDWLDEMIEEANRLDRENLHAVWATAAYQQAKNVMHVKAREA